MRLLGQKLEIDQTEIKQISEAQDRAFELVKTHLSKPLKQIESMGYTRIELACAYLTLAYHALRFNQPKEKADKSFDILTYFAKQRIESCIKENRQLKKLH